MVIVKKTKDGYTVFQKGDYSNHHAHTQSEAAAYVIKRNITKMELPITSDIRLLESHLRVATDTEYRIQLLYAIDRASHMKEKRKEILDELLSKKDEIALDPDVLNYTIRVLQNTINQPNEYHIDQDYIRLTYTDHFTLDLYSESRVIYSTTNESYKFKLSSAQVCHLIKRALQNKLKKEVYQTWDE